MENRLNKLFAITFLSLLCFSSVSTCFGQVSSPAGGQRNARPAPSQQQLDSMRRVMDDRLRKDWANLKRF
jgi:hypothetical protein